MDAPTLFRQAAQEAAPGETIRAARKAADMSQRDLADEIERSRSIVDKWERDERSPGWQSRQAMRELADDLESDDAADAEGGEQ